MPRPFGTCIIDPPWAYQQASKYDRETGERNNLTGYAIGHEYQGLKTEDIGELPIGELVDYGFLWTTGPFIEDSYKVIRSWEMVPITMLAWVKCAEVYTKCLQTFQERQTFDEPKIKFKPTYGVGYWFRGCVEPIILFKRKGVASIKSNWVGLLSPSAKHSRKPDTLHQLIETSGFPGPYLELFGRRSMPKWTVLGDEAPGDGLDIRISISNLLTAHNSPQEK